MAQETSLVWPWRVGLVLESPALRAEIAGILGEINADCAFDVGAGTPRAEIISLIGRESPQLIFAEMACIEGCGPDWIRALREGSEPPAIVAVHSSPEPRIMIDALRAGASEFLSLPLRPGIFEAMDRLATLLEARRTQSAERGKITGILSAKGGCGATTLACHLGAVARASAGISKVLIADLDWQSPAAHRVFRVSPTSHVGDALHSVRRLNSFCWPEFATKVNSGLDLLAGQQSGKDKMTPAEPWRSDSLFRFLGRNYTWVLADLGRQLNPANWGFLQNLDELIVVTEPDVLALYQTRSILQTLAGRGFEKDRLRLVLNKNRATPQDFWVESISQMFDMNVIAVIPDDPATNKAPCGGYQFPGNSALGRAVTKLGLKLARTAVLGPTHKSVAPKAA